MALINFNKTLKSESVGADRASLTAKKKPEDNNQYNLLRYKSISSN